MAWKADVEPLRFDVDPSGRIVVEVRKIVRDLAGAITADRIVHHVYRTEIVNP